MASRPRINGWARLVMAVAGVVSLSGCALLDPTDPYAGLAGQAWNEGVPIVRPPARSVEGPLTLARAIETSLANNPDLAAAGHGVEAAMAERDIAVGAVLPKVSVKGGYDYYLDRHRLGPPRFVGERRTYSDGAFSSDLVVSMPLFAGGRLISEIKAAELLAAASEHRLARTRQELVFNVSSVFYNILSQRHVIESLEFSQQALQEHLKRITELIHAQKAARVDQLRTEVRLADLEQRLVRERNVLAVQNRMLANLLGIAPQGSDTLAVVGELVMDTSVASDVDVAMVRAFSQREDYLAARAALEAQAKRVDVARAAQWPTLALQGSYGGRWAAGRLERRGDSAFDDVGSVGVAVEIPVFEGGRISARIRRERAELAAAQERMRKLELQVRLHVETAVLNISSSRQRVKATEKSIEQAKESLRIERGKYDHGKGAITDVLDAQAALLDSQMNYYRALSDYCTALAQFQLAVGDTQ